MFGQYSDPVTPKDVVSDIAKEKKITLYDSISGFPYLLSNLDKLERETNSLIGLLSNIKRSEPKPLDEPLNAPVKAHSGPVSIAEEISTKIHSCRSLVEAIGRNVEVAKSMIR